MKFLCIALLCFVSKTTSQETDICEFRCAQRDVFDVSCGGVECTTSFKNHPEATKLCAPECREAMSGHNLTLCVAESDPFRPGIDGEIANIVLDLFDLCEDIDAFGSVGALDENEAENLALLEAFDNQG